MTDITKCPGHDCPIKETCLRFTIHSDDLWQPWVAPAYDEKRKTCWNYIEEEK